MYTLCVYICICIFAYISVCTGEIRNMRYGKRASREVKTASTIQALVLPCLRIHVCSCIYVCMYIPSTEYPYMFTCMHIYKYTSIYVHECGIRHIVGRHP